MPSSDLSPRVIVQGLRTEVVGSNVTYFESIESTQDEAASVEDDDPEGAVFVAEEQTEGRGRHGRSWLAPRGSSLLLSVQLRPSAQAYRQFGMLAPLAAARAIEHVTGLPAAIKWPNDLLVHGRKVGGVLVEAEFFGEDPHFVAVGVGINANWDDVDLPDAAYPVTSLSRELGKPVSRNQLAVAFLNELDRLYLAVQRGASVYLDWRAKVSTLGQRVQVSEGARRYTGVAEDLAPDGALVVRRDDGSVETVYAADVTLAPAGA